MDMAYTKLHQSLVTSTIWREPNPTRIVWITMMALADQHGEVMASIPGLADAARVSIKECEDALRAFLAPDHYSRTKDFEGRRIEEIDGGWCLLNHPKYRRMASKDEAKEKASARTARYRARKKEASLSTVCDAESTQERDIAEAEAEADTKKKKPVATAPVVLPFDSQEFATAWQEWQQHRKEKRQKLTPSTTKKQFQTLARWGEKKAITAINTAIGNGWTGLFEPTGPASPTKTRPIYEPMPKRAYD